MLKRDPGMLTGFIDRVTDLRTHFLRQKCRASAMSAETLAETLEISLSQLPGWQYCGSHLLQHGLPFSTSLMADR